MFEIQREQTFNSYTFILNSFNNTINTHAFYVFWKEIKIRIRYCCLGEITKNNHTL